MSIFQTIKSALLGNRYVCDRCGEEFRGNRKACPECGHTVFSPVDS